MPTPITNFYTLAGLDNVYTDYNSANQETVQKGIRNIYPVSFTVKADAEAFRSGQWDTYLSNHYAFFFDRREIVDTDTFSLGSIFNQVLFGHF